MIVKDSHTQELGSTAKGRDIQEKFASFLADTDMVELGDSSINVGETGDFVAVPMFEHRARERSL